MFRQALSSRTGLVVALVLVSLSVTVPDASAATISARSGDVAAIFTYSGTFPQSRDARLTITRAGNVVGNVVVSSRWCGRQCWPDSVSPGHSVLHVVRLGPHGPLDVVLDLYSGGAHCCTVEQIFSWDASSGRYRKFEYNFGDPEAKLVPLGKGGSDVFLSADDSFAYAFTDYAASGLPIEILSFSNNALHNVTRSFSRLIANDATLWRKAFDSAGASNYQDTVGVAAAWAADEDMLGHSTSVANFLHLELRADHLNSALNPIEPSGRKFVADLQKFLRQHGYTK